MAAPKIEAQNIINKLDELPTLPSIVYELTQIINDPMSSTADVEKVMANDQSLTTKVLKLVNSAYYAIPGGVTSLARAITYIGFDNVHQLILSTSIIDLLKTKQPSSFDINEFWKHSVGVAVSAETIAKVTKHPMPSDMFTCGLVHDIGKMALFMIAESTLSEITQVCQEKSLSFIEAEEELHTVQHAMIGKLLTEKWRLPLQIQATVQFHHESDPNKRTGLSSDMNKSVDIIYLANLMTHALKFGSSGHNKVLGVPKEIMQRLTIDPATGFKPLAKKIKDSLTTAEDFIKIICS